jgi:threonine synthase
MTTLTGNVSAIAVDGKFDDCQAMVKRAFSDDELNIRLSSANSINIGRLIPQSIYYVYAYLKVVEDLREKIIFSVPCGNFGNLMGGLLAKNMGLPVKRFISATNENDEFPRYLTDGVYSPLKPSKACISNAMNVGHPSNLARLFHMYGGHIDEAGKVGAYPDLDAIKKDIWSVSISDAMTKKSIKDAYNDYGLLLEPHGAVSWAAMRRYKEKFGEFCGISLETADPGKFPEEVESALGFEPPIPASLAGLDSLSERIMHIPADYMALKEFLITLG